MYDFIVIKKLNPHLKDLNRSRIERKMTFKLLTHSYSLVSHVIFFSVINSVMFYIKAFYQLMVGHKR